MRTLQNFIKIILFSLTASSAATAQTSSDWRGFYVGVSTAASFGDTRQYSASGSGVNVGLDEALIGANAGYLFQTGNLVFGAEVDVQTGPSGSTAQGTSGPFWSCGTGACNADIEWFSTIRARGGYAINKWLLYGTAGYAFGDSSGGIFNSGQQGSGSIDGWTYGVGVERQFAQKSSIRLEYLHLDFDELEFGTGLGNEPFLGTGDFGMIKFGYNYHF